MCNDWDATLPMDIDVMGDVLPEPKGFQAELPAEPVLAEAAKPENAAEDAQGSDEPTEVGCWHPSKMKRLYGMVHGLGKICLVSWGI